MADSSNRRLAVTVHVADEHGAMHVFTPQDRTPVPGWAAEKITNPDAWQSDDEPDDGETGSSGGVPPRSGRGATKAAWAAFASAHGVEVTADMKSKDDIVAALTAAGVLTADTTTTPPAE